MSLRNKKIFSFFMSLALVFGMVLVPAQSFVYADGEDTVSLTIVHTNDIHSRVEADDSSIGFSRLATYVKKLKADNPNVLLLDAGDTTHGLPIATLSNGEAMVKFMNEVGYDAMVPGNHDFNYGYHRLVEFNEMAEFPILAANVIPVEGEMDLNEYIVKEMNGIKIGIFGVTTEESKYKSNPKNTEGVDITDPVAKATEMVEKLQEEEVDMIIALAHVGLDGESDPKSSDIAEQVEGIDLIVDGHSHSTFEEGLLVNDTLIVQTGEHLENVGKITVEFENGEVTKIEPTLFTREEAEALVEDDAVKVSIDELKELNYKELATVIGEANVDLVGEREIVRTRESNLGNLMTDALLEVTNADMALTNGGGIRASIPEGEITKNHVLATFPFGNYGVKMQISGADILSSLEHAVSGYPSAEGKFPHVAGATFKINPNAEAGNRVYDLMIQDEPVDVNKTYTLATNDFMAVGGDGYENLSNGKIIGEYSGFDEILDQHIETIGVVDIGVEGRIVVEAKEEVVELEEPTIEPEEPVVEPEQPVEQTPEVEEEVKEVVYVVKSGDTLYAIGLGHNTTWKKLSEYNSLDNPHLIFPAQEILIPVK